MNTRNNSQSRNGSRQGGASKNRNRNRKKRQAPDPVKFWGDPAALPRPENFDTDSPEPLAVVHSLGRAPLPGVAAEPYFAAVYDRAATLAQVLADAAGLDDLLTPESADDDLEPDEEE